MGVDSIRLERLELEVVLALREGVVDRTVLESASDQPLRY